MGESDGGGRGGVVDGLRLSLVIVGLEKAIRVRAEPEPVRSQVTGRQARDVEWQ